MSAVRCYGYGGVPCRVPVAWRVNTASGWVEFCDEHAQWYLDKGPDIYPVERVGWEGIRSPLAEASGPTDGPVGDEATAYRNTLRLVQASDSKEKP